MSDTRAFLLAAVLPFPAFADALEVHPVTDGVWALAGPKEQRDAVNLANNATFGLVVTDEGAVLIDPGGSWKGAEMLHDTIRSLTDQPVKSVIDTGRQDHRWLGNGYWQAQGATDQSAFSGLEQFDSLSRKNAEVAFVQMEFE